MDVGKDLELLCEVIGNPKPAVTWTFVDSVYSKQHNLIPADSSKLVLRNVSYLNEGKCNLVSLFFVSKIPIIRGILLRSRKQD